MTVKVRKVKSVVWSLFLTASLFLHLAAVRKKEDPILKTQTDPIAYKEKMEEIKDGEKGAPAPSMERYPQSGFLSKPPVVGESRAPEKKDSGGGAIPNLGEPIPEDQGVDTDEEIQWEELSESEDDGREEGVSEDEEEFKEDAEMDVKPT